MPDIIIYIKKPSTVDRVQQCFSAGSLKWFVLWVGWTSSVLTVCLYVSEPEVVTLAVRWNAHECSKTTVYFISINIYFFYVLRCFNVFVLLQLSHKKKPRGKNLRRRRGKRKKKKKKREKNVKKRRNGKKLKRQRN